LVRRHITSQGHSWFIFALWLVPSLVLADLTPEQKIHTLTLADSLYAAGAADSSQVVLMEAIPAARAARDSIHLQNLIVRRGSQLAAFGQAGQSEPILREGLALAEANGDSVTVCSVLRWLGLSIANQGRWDEAEVTTRRQIELADALGLPVMAGWAHVALGWYAEQRGRMEAASGEYRRAITIFRGEGDDQGTAWSLNNLGNTLLDGGDRRGAREAYLEAADMAKRVDYTFVEAMAANNLGVMEFDGGDPALALEGFRRAYDLQAMLGHAVEKIVSGLNIGLCLVYLNRLGEAADQLEGTMAEAEALDQPEVAAQARLALASLRFRQGRYRSAKRLWLQVADEPRDISSNLRTEGMRSVAFLLAREDSVSAALDLLTRAGAGLTGQPNSVQALRVSNLRGELLVTDGRPAEALFFLRDVENRASAIGLSGQRIQALAHAARAHRALGQPDSSLVLLTRASQVWEAERSLPSDPEWREQRGALGSRIHTDWAVQRLVTTDRGLGDDPLPEVFRRMQKFKGRTLLERMRGPGVLALQAISLEETGFVTLEVLQRDVLEDGELFLDFYLGPEASVLFAITREEVRWVELPPDDELTGQVGFYFDVLQVPATGEVSSSETAAVALVGSEIGDLLLGGVADMIEGAGQVWIAPDGILNRLPWKTLRISREGGIEGALAMWDHGVVLVPSVTILKSLRGRSGERSIADPARILAVAGEATSDIPALPGAEREINWLVGRYTRTRRSVEGSVDWDAFDVLHIAAHVRSQGVSPWRSTIDLGGDPPRSERADAIAGMNLPVSLVVLAGCESAGGEILAGEGVQGLTQAFLGAGAASVLGTLWPVDDRTTFEFVRYFYQEMASGLPSSGALSKAQAKIRKNPLTVHPFFWAGFVLVGDGDVKVHLEERRRLGLGAALPLALFILLVILWGRRRLS